ncbi:MAG: TRAM domain-containing protein, partial [Thermoguttaceae bacterium]
QTVSTLVDGKSEKPNLAGAKQLVGRTACDRIVAFDGPESLIGQFVEVNITDALPFTLLGRI